MGGTISSLGGRLSTTLFTDHAQKPPRTFLQAAVLWRHEKEQVQRSSIPVWGFMARVLAYKLTRLKMFLPKYENMWHPPEGWVGSADGGGANAVLLHRQHGIVSVLGREFRLPPEGRALILLVDGDDSATATFTELSVACEPIPAIDVDRTQDRKVIAAQMAAAHRAQHGVLNQIIRSDPTASAFLESAERE